jgi:hypothetical protein
MTKAKLIAVLIAIFAPIAEAVDLTWSPVTQDTAGGTIPAGMVKYTVYYSADDVSYTYAAETTQLKMSVDAVTTGCYFFHVTAVRTDVSLESVPSNSIEYCAGDLVPEPPISASNPEAPQGVNVVE